MTGRIHTDRLVLIAASVTQLRADLEGRSSLARALGVEVPAGWPPELFDADAINFILPLVAADPAGSRWGFYYVVLRRAQDGGDVVIGAGGFKGPPTIDGEVEIGYSVLPGYRGRGFAGEAVAGWLQKAFGEPRVSNVVAHTLESLSPSIRVLQRAGFERAGTANAAAAPPGETIVRYELGRSEYEARRVATKRPVMPSRARVGSARVASGKIVFAEHGGGDRVVVLLHGIPGDRSCWADVAERLAPNYRVIVPDLLGFGESDPVPPTFHAQDQARAVVELLQGLRATSVHLVGFDFGGPTAVAVTGLAPHMVASLTLANTNILPDTPIPLPLRVASVPLLGRLAYRVFFGRLGLTGMWLAATRQKSAFPKKRFLEILSSARTVQTTQDVFFTSMRDLPGLYGPILQTLQRVRVPTLVIWSDRDPFFSVAIGSKTASVAPHGHFVLLEDTGHFTPNERPEEFARAVIEHIARAEHSDAVAGGV